MENIPQAFSGKKDRQQTDQQALIEQLYQRIGQFYVLVNYQLLLRSYQK